MSKILESPTIATSPLGGWGATPALKSGIANLCEELSASLRRPSRRTLKLIDRALSYLTPFESPLANAASPSERRDLLDLVKIHRLHLSPYLDLDRIERNLRMNRCTT